MSEDRQPVEKTFDMRANANSVEPSASYMKPNFHYA